MSNINVEKCIIEKIESFGVVYNKGMFNSSKLQDKSINFPKLSFTSSGKLVLIEYAENKSDIKTIRERTFSEVKKIAKVDKSNGIIIAFAVPITKNGQKLKLITYIVEKKNKDYKFTYRKEIKLPDDLNPKIILRKLYDPQPLSWQLILNCAGLSGLFLSFFIFSFDNILAQVDVTIITVFLLVISTLFVMLGNLLTDKRYKRGIFVFLLVCLLIFMFALGLHLRNSTNERYNIYEVGNTIELTNETSDMENIHITNEGENVADGHEIEGVEDITNNDGVEIGINESETSDYLTRMLLESEMFWNLLLLVLAIWYMLSFIFYYIYSLLKKLCYDILEWLTDEKGLIDGEKVKVLWPIAVTIFGGIGSITIIIVNLLSL